MIIIKTLFNYRIILSFCLLFFFQSNGQEQEFIKISYEKEIPTLKGLNGSFSGIHNGVLILAGGTNFPNKAPWDGGKKEWYSDIYVLEKKENQTIWYDKLSVSLPRALANGVSINTNQGLLCFGGDNKKGVFNTVYLLKWNENTKEVEIESLPPMPIPLSNMSGAVVDDIVYLIGGQQEKDNVSTNNFLSFNIKSSIVRPKYSWKKHQDFPFKSRIQSVVVGQSNGHQECLYVISGLSYNPNHSRPYDMLYDVYQFNPFNEQWSQKANVPFNNTPSLSGGYLAAAPSIKKGDAHVLVFGGAGGPNQHLSKRMEIWSKLKDKSLSNEQIELLKEEEIKLIKTTSFSRTIWSYHTITDNWVVEGAFDSDTQVVTNALNWGDDVIIPGGEIRPGVRTNRIKKINLKTQNKSFGVVNYVTLITYLILIIFLGWYFSKRNKTTDDYFLGGGRIPWWAAGLSIYATMLSSITYISQPALAYSFDWQAYLGYFPILLIVPLVITYYLPFFKKLHLTTAYEYLEKRFHVSIRIFSSSFFVLFQLVRMGIVVYLPALALSTAIGLDLYVAIISMGVLSIIYTYLGGIEAVIWTDVIQVGVLIIGLIAGLVYIGMEINDFGLIWDTAIEDGKLKMLDFRFSFTEVVTWSLFLGSFALSFTTYTTDQTVIQRYMTTSNEKEARKSIWLNGILSIPFGILIFAMGTFLYVYFKEHPEFLTVGMQNDSVFPLFITNHLPQGVAGLVIAGIFSASMSSLDSSMHSISTVITVDYYKRFYSLYSDLKGLAVAKWTTLIVGVIGTSIACLMATFPVTSIFFFFQETIGLFGSAIAGIFILGIFIKKAHWKGALIGAVASITVLVFIKYSTLLNFYIYPLIGIPLCVIIGWVFSLLITIPQPDISGLVYQRKPTNIT